MDKIWQKLFGVIKCANEEAKKLAGIADANQNTRRDIKESVTAMVNLMVQLTTGEMVDLMTTRLGKMSHTMKKAAGAGDIEVAYGKIGESRERTANRAIQTEDSDTNTCREITREQIRVVQNIYYDRIKKLDWPNEVYMSRYVGGSIVDVEVHTDLLVWEESPKISTQSNGLYKWYEDLRNARRKKAAVYLNSRTVDFDGKKTERDQILVKFGTEHDCFLKLRESRELMMKQGKRSIALYPAGGSHLGPSYRKMSSVFLVEAPSSARFTTRIR